MQSHYPIAWSSLQEAKNSADELDPHIQAYWAPTENCAEEFITRIAQESPSMQPNGFTFTPTRFGMGLEALGVRFPLMTWEFLEDMKARSDKCSVTIDV